MQPWKVSIGLTVTALGVAVVFGLPELSYLEPHWKVLLRDYWLTVTLYGGLAVASFAFSIYAGCSIMWDLADLGRKVDLAERSIRRGEGGDPELAEALHNQSKGKFLD